MLTNEEVESLIAAARNSRDRAMISILYEGGLRPIELVRLTWRHVKLDKDGAVLSIESSVNKKTGKPRYVRLINSGALLAAWKYDHPIDKLNGPVFVKRRAPYAPITTTTIRHVIEDAVSRSGITKHVHPYLFRHTRVTHMLEEEVPDNIIKLQHWGSLNTPMLATYGHISNEAVDRILLERAGIKRAPEKRKKAALHPIQCPDCEFVNPPGARFCMDCAYPFTEEGKDLKRALDQARHDPQVLRDFADWLEQKNNKEQRI